MREILTKQQVINTYNGVQQEQCKLYYAYKEIKKQNPGFGYKRISKLLGQKNLAKTRWWNCGRYTPFPIEVVNFLEERGLLSLNENDSRLRLIAKILGCTFGDGGIYATLNAIFCLVLS